MLDSETIKKIEDFVYSKPRNIQEIAKHIDKSWRTADRYVKEIEEEYGTIATRTFRKGTRGALKVVYWASIEKASSSIFQEKLEEEIKIAKDKMDFSAFDIYQHIDDKKKKVTIEKAIKENTTNLKELAEILKKTENQLLVFSGNLSFLNLKNDTINMMEIMEELIKKGVNIKVLCRVDLAGIKNIEKLLSLNFKYGKELIEIHHNEHPIRAFIVDKNLFRIKEIKEPTGKINELDKKTFIFYTIKDQEWVDWLAKIFWNLFSNSIKAEKRIEELKKLK